MIAVTTTTKVCIVSEIKIQGRMSEHIQLLQVDSNKAQIYVESADETEMFVFQTQINIKGLDCTDDHMLVWDGKLVEINKIIRELDNTETNLIHSFE